MIFDTTEDFLNGDELLAAREDARSILRLWKRRAIYAAISLCLSCAAVVPFSKGEPFHAYAEPFGRTLVYLSMGLLVPFVICIGIAVSSWMHLRDLMKVDRKLPNGKGPSL